MVYFIWQNALIKPALMITLRIMFVIMIIMRRLSNTKMLGMNRSRSLRLALGKKSGSGFIYEIRNFFETGDDNL